MANTEASLLELQRTSPDTLLGVPFAGVLAWQLILLGEQANNSLTHIIKMAEVLAENHPDPGEESVGLNVIQFCLSEPLRINPEPGTSPEESVRLLLLDIRDFVNFVALRNNLKKRSAKWHPSFSYNSPAYALNILPPLGEPESYFEDEWAVDKYSTIIPGIFVELSSRLGYITDKGNWIFPKDNMIQYIIDEDALG